MFWMAMNSEPNPCMNEFFADSGKIEIPLYFRSRSKRLNSLAYASTDIPGLRKYSRKATSLIVAILDERWVSLIEGIQFQDF